MAVLDQGIGDDLCCVVLGACVCGRAMAARCACVRVCEFLCRPPMDSTTRQNCLYVLLAAALHDVAPGAVLVSVTCPEAFLEPAVLHAPCVTAQDMVEDKGFMFRLHANMAAGGAAASISALADYASLEAALRGTASLIVSTSSAPLLSVNFWSIRSVAAHTSLACTLYSLSLFPYLAVISFCVSIFSSLSFHVLLCLPFFRRHSTASGALQRRPWYS